MVPQRYSGGCVTYFLHRLSVDPQSQISQSAGLSEAIDQAKGNDTKAVIKATLGPPNRGLVANNHRGYNDDICNWRLYADRQHT